MFRDIEHQRRRRKANKVRYKIRNKAIVDKKKSDPCTDCRKCFPVCAMDLDHLPQFQKWRDVAFLVNSGTSLPTLLRELDKCEVVCATCHRIRTWNRKHPDNQIQMEDRWDLKM